MRRVVLTALLFVACQHESALPGLIEAHCHEMETSLGLAATHLATGSAGFVVGLGKLSERSTITHELTFESAFCASVHDGDSTRLYDQLVVFATRFNEVSVDDVAGQGSAIQEVAQLLRQIDALPLKR